MSLGGISNLDYTVILCSDMAATRAFYRDVMQFAIEVDGMDQQALLLGAFGAPVLARQGMAPA